MTNGNLQKFLSIKRKLDTYILVMISSKFINTSEFQNFWCVNFFIINVLPKSGHFSNHTVYCSRSKIFISRLANNPWLLTTPRWFDEKNSPHRTVLYRVDERETLKNFTLPSYRQQHNQHTRGITQFSCAACSAGARRLVWCLLPALSAQPIVRNARANYTMVENRSI